MSGQKQVQQQQQGSTSKRELEADFLFNQHIVRTVGYTAAGFGFGLATSLLFKHKAGMTMFFSGAGAGYGASNFFNDLHQFRKYKSLGQNQGQQYQRGGPSFEQLGGRSAQLSEGLQYAKNQAQGAANEAQNKLEQGAQNLKEKGKDALNQAKNAGEQALNKAGEGLENAKNQAKSGADNAQGKLNEGLQHAKNQAKNLAGQAKNAAENIKDQAKNAGEQAYNKANEGLQHAKDQAKNLAGQAKNTGENLKDQAKNAADQAQNKAKEGLQNAKDQAKNAADQAQSKAKDGLQNAKDQAKNAAENVQNKANEASNKGKDSKDREQLVQRRIDETVPNIKQQGKDTAGGTSSNAGGDAYQRETGAKKDAERNEASASRVASEQKAKNTKSGKEGTSAQGDHNADSTERVNGQTFQSFDSNSHKEGKAGLTHEIQTNYQENRNRFREQAANENRTNLTRQGQDPYFKSETEGIGRVNDMKSDTQMGAHGYKKGATEELKGNKIEVDPTSEKGKVA